LRAGRDGVLTRVSESSARSIPLLGLRARRHAFTFVEMLVVIAIIGVLLAMLMPALSAVRRSSKALVCSANMQTLLTDFRFFADGDSTGGRGKSEQLGRGRFWINDFQDSLYHMDEFWDGGSAATTTLSSSDSPMLCPAGARQLTKRKGFPCGRQAVSPVEDVSLAVNMRLYRAVLDVQGKKLLASPTATHLSTRILDRPYVPLILDVDGKQAVAGGVDPFYVAPPIPGVDDPYASGRYWSPARRHNGKTIVGFVGGHVLTSEKPEKERWDWSYQGELGR
jgi:prepilin-type N-terminal cleavage/methylation domain-containing protein/prepilin-type processing-associated H-X9-DG protein